MKTLRTTLPVQYKFFGAPKPLDAQLFESKLAEFRVQAYASLTGNHDFPRACCLIDGGISCLIDKGINAIRTLLQNIWNTPEKLEKIKWPVIGVCMQVDNNYTAYYVRIVYHKDLMSPQYETAESDNFEKAVQAEKDEVYRKYGFKELPPKQYKVLFDNREAVLSEQQLRELRKEQPEFFVQVVEEVK